MLKLLMFALFLTGSVLAESGLKKTNFDSKTSDEMSNAQTGSYPALSPEQSRQLMDDVEVIKKKQAEQKRALDELDAEDE